MHRWLKHDGYKQMAECPEGFPHPFSRTSEPFSFNPLDPASIDFMESLYKQLVPHFASKTLNVGLDETFDLGRGASAKACAKRGRGRVYLDYLLAIYQRVTKMGLGMQYWGDIIVNHPELVGELPKVSQPHVHTLARTCRPLAHPTAHACFALSFIHQDAAALIWGYEANHPFDSQCKLFADNGIPFYVVPGTSSWNSFVGRTGEACAAVCACACCS